MVGVVPNSGRSVLTYLIRTRRLLLPKDPAENQLSNEPRYYYGYTIVIASFLIMTIIFGSYLSYGVFLKPVLTEFGWSSAILSGAFSLSMIIHGTLGIFMGGVTDRFGPHCTCQKQFLDYFSTKGILRGIVEPAHNPSIVSVLRHTGTQLALIVCLRT